MKKHLWVPTLLPALTLPILGAFRARTAGALAELTDVALVTTGDDALATGQVLVYNATTSRWANADEQNVPVRLGSAQSFAELVGVAPSNDWGEGWYSVTSGNVTPVNVQDEPGHDGVQSMTTGASAAGFATINYGSPFSTADQVFRQDGRMRMSVLARIPVLSDAAQRFVCGLAILGLRSDLGEDFGFAGTGANAIGLLYSDDINGGRWFVRKRIAGVNTDVDTGITATTSWALLELQVSANGNGVSAWINGVQVVNNSDISTITNGPFTPYFGIRKRVGTTARTLRVDFVNMVRRFAVSR